MTRLSAQITTAEFHQFHCPSACSVFGCRVTNSCQGPVAAGDLPVDDTRDSEHAHDGSYGSDLE